MQNHLATLCCHRSLQHASNLQFKKHQLLFTVFFLIAFCFALLTANTAWTATTSTDIPEFALEPTDTEYPADLIEDQKNTERTYSSLVLKRTGVNRKDPYIWAYTAQFAKKFRMPEEWIAHDLQGAEAIALRVASPDFINCGWGGDRNACSPLQNECLLDIYFDNNKQKLPWDPRRRWTDLNTEFTSVDFISYAIKLNRPYNSVWKPKTPFTHPKNGKELIWWAFASDRSSGVLFLKSYDRSIFYGVSLVTLDGGCFEMESIQLKHRGIDSFDNEIPIHSVIFPNKWRKKIEEVVRVEKEKNNKFYKGIFDKLKK